MSAPRRQRLTRELVALCHRDIAERPPDPRYDYFSEEDYDAAVRALIAAKPEGPLWLFAYGSLIWKPEFAVAEMRRAVAQGWKRGFSLRIENFRATPEQHGFMMCLDPGGSCEGMILRVSEPEEHLQIRKLLYRELGSHEALEAARWIDVVTAAGCERALTFYARPHLLDYYAPDRPLPEIAYALARACGHWGSGAEYLHNTVSHLAELGIFDEDLWELQDLVAQEIERLYA